MTEFAWCGIRPCTIRNRIPANVFLLLNGKHKENKMKIGDRQTVLYGRATISGKIVHIEGKSAILKVEKSTDHNVVAPGQTVIVSVPVK